MIEEEALLKKLKKKELKYLKVLYTEYPLLPRVILATLERGDHTIAQIKNFTFPQEKEEVHKNKTTIDKKYALPDFINTKLTHEEGELWLIIQNILPTPMNIELLEISATPPFFLILNNIYLPAQEEYRIKINNQESQKETIVKVNTHMLISPIYQDRNYSMEYSNSYYWE